MDAVAGAEDVRTHLGVPTTGLVTEMHAGFQHLLHADVSHFPILQKGCDLPHRPRPCNPALRRTGPMTGRQRKMRRSALPGTPGRCRSVLDERASIDQKPANGKSREAGGRKSPAGGRQDRGRGPGAARGCPAKRMCGTATGGTGRTVPFGGASRHGRVCRIRRDGRDDRTGGPVRKGPPRQKKGSREGSLTGEDHGVACQGVPAV